MLASATYSEHFLVDAEKDRGDSGGSDGWLGKDVLQGKVLQIADESRSSVGEGERETPEEPLERTHGDGHGGEEEHGEGVFTS